MITKVGMLIIVEPNVEEAVEFYKKLGMTLQFHMKQKWAEFQIGDVKIGLCPAEVTGDRHTGIVLEVDDLSATAEQLKKENIAFVKEPVEAVHGIMASIKDPGGNMIDLYQPTPEKLREFIQQQEAAKAASEGQGDCSGCQEDSCCDDQCGDETCGDDDDCCCG